MSLLTLPMCLSICSEMVAETTLVLMLLLGRPVHITQAFGCDDRCLLSVPHLHGGMMVTSGNHDLILE